MKTEPAVLPSPLPKGLALHKQLFMVLSDEIARGLYPSRFLPSEEVLCERFGVSRITVRRALADLAQLGVVERRHGRGTYVRADPSQALRSPSLQFMEAVKARGSTPAAVDVVKFERVVPPPDIAAILQLGPQEQAVNVVRVRINAEGRPASLTDVWVPARVDGRFSKAMFKKKAVYEVLVEQGVQFGRVVQMFSATVSDPERARLLQTDVGEALLKLVRLVHDNQSLPVLYLVAHLPAHRASVLMETDGNSINTLSAGMVFLDDADSGALS